ncbi:MAG: glycosyltransferase [Clostridia bacterium]|nr:glycosyltransferase [Clostridia bacterium]
MKKLLIVNNNMKIGGVQKSLYNLLWSIDTVNEYDVTLLLFSKAGAYTDSLPESIRIKECKGLFRLLGRSQSEHKSNLKDYLIRAILATATRIFGRASVLRFLLLFEPMLDEEYDCAISFLHNGSEKSFYGGTQDYVLSRVKAEKKVAFIHGDYVKCGACCSSNNRMLGKFDAIAACSDGCRRVLTEVLPELENKFITVRNFNRYDEIKNLSAEESVIYDSSFVNIIMVARLSNTKGIDRAVKALAFCVKKGIRAKLHIVGGGSLKEQLETLAKNEGVGEYVLFYGEQNNPYRYMKNADMLLIASYHEAAPMVIDEAFCLALPVLSTKTTSTDEMILEPEIGWVCGNLQDALNNELFDAVSDREKLIFMKKKLSEKCADNTKAISQFKELINN